MPESVLAGAFASIRAQICWVGAHESLTVVPWTNPVDFEPFSGGPSRNVTSDRACVHNELWVQDDSVAVVPHVGGEHAFDGDEWVVLEQLRESLGDSGDKVYDSGGVLLDGLAVVPYCGSAIGEFVPSSNNDTCRLGSRIDAENPPSSPRGHMVASQREPFGSTPTFTCAR